VPVKYPDGRIAAPESATTAPAPSIRATENMLPTSSVAPAATVALESSQA
jgi:hypothetical protein